MDAATSTLAFRCHCLLENQLAHQGTKHLLENATHNLPASTPSLLLHSSCSLIAAFFAATSIIAATTLYQ